MKTRILLFMIAWLSLAPAVQAADGLTLSAVTLKPGEEADLTVSITQETNSYTGFQFDITLPDGLSLVADGSGKQYTFANSQTNSPVCDVEDLGHHAYRYVVYSDAMSAFRNGEVLSLRVKAVSGMAYGEYLLTLNNVILSDADGNTVKPAGRNYKVGIVADHLEENVSLESTVIKAGDTEDVSLTITQELEKYTGFQFDVTLPEGFSLESGTGGTVYTLSSSQTNNPVCDVESLGCNAYRFVVYSNSSTPFKNGDVLSLHVKAKSGMELKDYSLQLSQIILSDADGNVTKLGSRVSTVKVTGFFTLTYQMDGNTYKSSTVEYGASITPEAAPTKEGYTFSGWSEIPQTMPAKDVIITGTFTVNKYKLTYKVDGTEYKTVEVAYGTSITAEAAPAKEGFTFSGWSEIPSTMPANDVTITGTFTVNRYTLTYQVDGQEYKTISYNYGAGISPEQTPTKTGYTFSGWSEIPSTMPAKDITVTGTFTVNKYKLVYKLDGEEYKSSEVEYGASITPEAVPTKEGHTFSGWSGIPSTMPAEDVIITGTFTVNKYKLIYKVDGEEYKSIEVEYGTSITPEAAPTKDGYTFSGWSDIPQTMPAENVIVMGTFTKGVFILTYVVDGETYKTISYDYGASVTPESEPTKDGYTFSGWSNIPSTMPSEDVTVTGTFTVNKYKLIYQVDGIEYKTCEVEYGTNITAEPEPTKEGYTFSGWGNIPSTMPAGDVTITGSFTANKYKLIYQVDGVEYKSSDVEYGANITPEAVPTKEGYTFSGWSEIPNTMPANDVTITGTFSVNKYKLTYQVDGEDYKTISYDFGAAITAETEPSKEGYTFSGWSEIPSSMPAHDVIVMGTFTKGAFILTYVVDGETYKTVSYDYGESITPESEPTKEGYTFSGWSKIPSTMPSEDVTVTGSFTVNYYKLTYLVDGEVYKSFEVEYGVGVVPESVPTKEGYTFSGWSDIPSSMPAHDVTVTGSFSKGSYTLTYVVNGETYKTVSYDYGENITPESEPTKEGYTFSGWSGEPNTMPSEDVTVTGSFTVNYYKLTYMVDGEVYKTFEVEYGVGVVAESAPTKEGYTFSGWSEIPSSMPAHDVTVTGSFTKGSHKLIYIVDGETYKTVSYDYGSSITPESEPTKEGYTFSGWSEIPSTMPSEDVTVTGSFTVNYYKLTYMVDGEVYKTGEAEYGTRVPSEDEPTKEGYTFSGWDGLPSSMPAEDVTITGTFTINQYELTYQVDGETYKTVSYDYGASITAEAEPTKEGYTFSGWSKIPTTMPAEDVTVTGSFTVNKYKLTYMIDGKVYKEVEVEYGATITPEPQPEGDYVSFSWTGLPEVMPAKDVTVQADYVTGINGAALNDKGQMINDKWYDLKGRRISQPKKGVNILRDSSGRMKKVVVK